MALPADPTDPAASPSTFANARITAEEAERLAAAFRPSWEVDDAPPYGAGSATGAGSTVPRSAGTTADVRGPVQALNGTHAPAPATILMHEEPASSVIVDGMVPPPEASPALPAQPRHDRPATSGSARAVMPQQRTLVMTNSPVPAAIAAERRRARTLGLSKVDFRPSRTGFWIGAGAAAGALIGIVAWLASGSGEKAAAPAPVVETPHTAARAPIPPPPPIPTPPPIETAAREPAAPPLPAASTAPPPAPVVAASSSERPVAAPAPPPPPRWVAPQPQAPRPTWTPTTTPPKPLPRPKQGQTIVRDVPF